MHFLEIHPQKLKILVFWDFQKKCYFMSMNGHIKTFLVDLDSCDQDLSENIYFIGVYFKNKEDIAKKLHLW